jgi:hypothetical protein
MQRPDIRDLLARQAALAPKRASAEDFLAGVDKWLNLPISLEMIGQVAGPLGGKLGIRTGKTRRERIALRPGRALVNVMAMLARHGYHVKTVHQELDSCSIVATIPSDFRSWEGTLTVTIRRAAEFSEVEAAVSIKGQLYDWGKGSGIVKEFFDEITKQPA